MPRKADKGTGRGRGRPREPRALSAQALAHARELTQYYDPAQPPLAPISQQDMGGGVGHVGGEQQEVVADASVIDLTEDAASSSNGVTSLSTHTNAASSEQTCSGSEHAELNIPPIFFQKHIPAKNGVGGGTISLI